MLAALDAWSLEWGHLHAQLNMGSSDLSLLEPSSMPEVHFQHVYFTMNDMIHSIIFHFHISNIRGSVGSYTQRTELLQPQHIHTANSFPALGPTKASSLFHSWCVSQSSIFRC